MKRKFFIFLSVIFILSMISVPAFATGSLVFAGSTAGSWEYTDSRHFDFEPGYYQLFFYTNNIGQHDCRLLLETVDPVYLDYLPFGPHTISVDFLVHDDSYSHIDGLYFFSDGNGSNRFWLAVSGKEYQNSDTVTLYVSRVPAPPVSITDFVSSDMMSGVLDQVVSMLPVVLVVIIGFIAVRKGISFLRGFLAGS